MISSELGRIIVSGDFNPREMQSLLAVMHKMTSQQGFRDIELDFSNCVFVKMLFLFAVLQRPWPVPTHLNTYASRV